MKNLDEALSLIPGATKLALHAVYRDETGKGVERNALGPEHLTLFRNKHRFRGFSFRAQSSTGGFPHPGCKV